MEDGPHSGLTGTPKSGQDEQPDHEVRHDGPRIVAFTRIREWFRPLAYLGQNALTLAGAALTTSAALTMIVFWVAEILRDRPTHPYEGILLFLILPAVFVLGLLLMPAGIFLRRRSLKREGGLPSVYPHVDFHLADARRALAVVAVLTVVNLILLSTASYKGVEYMESNQFCGLTCHKVMAPQYSAFVDSPHARVGCVRCHIGPGASWFVRSKLSGVRQVFAVALETYSRPIPVAGQAPAPGARDLRAVPLAGTLRGRPLRRAHPLRRRREELALLDGAGPEGRRPGRKGRGGHPRPARRGGRRHHLHRRRSAAPGHSARHRRPA